MLTSYLFKTISGIQVLWRRRGRGGEVDVVVRNLSPSGLPLPWLGEFALIECKDRQDRIRSPELGAFLAKLTLTGIQTGIVVSRNGLTGQGKRRFAEEIQHHALSRSNIVVIDVLTSELVNLDSTEAFLALLQTKYESIRLGQS